jgi:hypothetical protein
MIPFKPWGVNKWTAPHAPVSHATTSNLNAPLRQTPSLVASFHSAVVHPRVGTPFGRRESLFPGSRGNGRRRSQP